ncbi:GNAT family N-acetyltransferase [Neobacillus ginsengisoli]|uniref:Acetyltransferase n=1 Tax=Neobacillus ginsengisoli TaxID=904295 RepID=A0ABT9XSV6_9BACI|nr:GNAT family N-acetyltransferase [Neobacillus ginsengisoli]MDQ0198463.1 putative acetyltransferase [Neobacillus ginsengisoli]
MEVKILTEQDYLESMKLSMYAFQYKIPETEIQSRKETLKNHKILGIWEQSKLAAKLHIIPFHIFINGAKWKMGGIAGVATYPEYRRSGYVKTLILDSLKRMKEDRQIVSLLHPFDISFYRKFGWEILSEHKKATIEKINLQFLQAQPGFIKRYSKDHYHPDIEKVYCEYAKGYSGMLVREAKWWANSVYEDDNQIAVYYNQSQEAVGYILYNVQKKKMVVKEIAALNQEAKTGLWNFICQHDSMVESVSINLSYHDSFPYLLKNPNVKMEIEPYFMARLVDVEACLIKFPFLQENETIFIHLEDTFASWNNGSYLIGNGEIRAFKGKTGSQCVHPPKKGIQLTINSLSAILFGYKRPMELYEMGYLKGLESEVEKLEKIIPNNKTAFFDFF